MQLYVETFRFEDENDENDYKDLIFLNSNKTPGRQLEIFNVLFSPERLSQLFLLKEVNPFAPEPPVTARADPGPFYPLWRHQF